MILGFAPLRSFLVGCGAREDSLTAQARAGDERNYTAGDDSVNEYLPQARGAKGFPERSRFSGEGGSSDDWTGKVVVLNFWYAACSPCRKEAPDLAAFDEDFKEVLDVKAGSVPESWGFPKALVVSALAGQ